MTPTRRLPYAAAICAALAGLAMLLPWHRVRDSGFGDAIGCMATTERCPESTPRPSYEDTAVDHGGPVPLLALLTACAVLIGAAHVGTRGAWRTAGLVSALLVVLAGVLTGLSSIIPHLLDHTTTLPAEGACALLGLAAFVLACVVATRAHRLPPQQHGGAR